MPEVASSGVDLAISFDLMSLVQDDSASAFGLGCHWLERRLRHRHRQQPTDIVGAGSLTGGTDSTGTASNDTGTAAVTSGGFLAELLSLF